jgi:hypothetical protein
MWYCGKRALALRQCHPQLGTHRLPLTALHKLDRKSDAFPRHVNSSIVHSKTTVMDRALDDVISDRSVCERMQLEEYHIT